uniref:Uncharacterized protein n=1 Tax=Anguilla anguilla TaxID=7936 RepID=A0A0E9VJJ3_ANGAN
MMADKCAASVLPDKNSIFDFCWSNNFHTNVKLVYIPERKWVMILHAITPQ